MNPMVKELTIIIAGQEIKVKVDGQTTIVPGEIKPREYFMTPKEVEYMLNLKIGRENIRTRKYQ